MLFFKQVSAALLAVAAATASAGSVVSKEVSVALSGKPTGRVVKYGGESLYVSLPFTKMRPEVGVLFLTDIFGIQNLDNKLVVDSFARAGYAVVAPDLFRGKPAPEDTSTPGFNLTQFIANNNNTVVDPIIDVGIEYLAEKLGVETTATAGYCFGGRHAFRVLNGKRGVDIGFVAHPSFATNDEIRAVVSPVTLATASHDAIFPLTSKLEAETILANKTIPFSTSLYSGVEHGFAIQANASIPQQRVAKQEAFLQAVRFFKTWI
ncbi:hypothetical protein FDECE_5065 [Fusarium decemcellulare]|nr:hypothetical protein FDECE_5065 [Fusarium decemcellulare]